MREIKFRAWDKNLNKMDYNPIIDGIEVGAIGINNFFDNSQIPMQYTGLKDKNGKEIYEGDIVRAKWIFSSCRGVIEYVPKTMQFMLREKDNDLHSLSGEWKIKDGLKVEIEVIGNIYENPEFIK
jgi:uncharacterized phage protein (TIGR01671 family)